MPIASHDELFRCAHPCVRSKHGLVTRAICLGCQCRIISPLEPLPNADQCTDMAARIAAVVGHRSSAPRLRVGFVTPNLVLGGAEFWILGLLTYCDSDVLAWSGVAVTGGDECDERMCRRAAIRAPLYGGPLGAGRAVSSPERGLIHRFATSAEALRRLCVDSDILIVWGVADLGQYLDRLRFTGQVVLVSHGAGSWTETILRKSREAAQWLVGVSRPAAAAFGMPGAVVIHNGGDHDRCRITRPRAEVRREWGARDGDRLIGYVGRYSWEKNPAAAALAVSALGPPYRAVYVGSGWKEEEVRASVGRLAPDAIFAPPMTDIGNALNALDVMVLASPSEGFSLVLTEAWLCGLPAVATRVGAVPELEAMHGQLVTPVSVRATAEELADAVKMALALENQSVVAHAKDVAWRHYTAQAMADRWTEFLARIGSSKQAIWRTSIEG